MLQVELRQMTAHEAEINTWKMADSSENDWNECLNWVWN